jgi:hypothetical protein
MGDDALEDEEQDEDGILFTGTPGILEAPLKDTDRDSVIGDEDADQDVQIKDAPTSDTIAPEVKPAPSAKVETKGEIIKPSSCD